MCKDVCGALFKIATHKNGKNLDVIYTPRDARGAINVSQAESPFHILLYCWSRDCTHFTSQTPGPAGFPLGSSSGRHLRRLEGRARGEGTVSSCSFLSQHPHPSSSHWLQPPFVSALPDNPPRTPPRYQHLVASCSRV